VRRLVSVTLAGATLLVARVSSAQAEWNTGLIGGACGVGEQGAVWNRSRVCLGGRTDLLWGRQAPGEAAGGGFLGVTTAGFRDITFEGGGAALLPLGDAWTTVFSLGPALQLRETEWEPGFASWAFVGRRGFNYHGRYAMAWGFVVGYERGLGSRGASTLTMGVQLDGIVLALPVMFTVDALRRHRAR
jgi:hypothetical protein